MITPELLDFLRSQQAEGMEPEEMERLLVTEGGWNQEDVTEAFRQIGIVPPPPVVAESPVQPIEIPTEEGVIPPQEVVEVEPPGFQGVEPVAEVETSRDESAVIKVSPQQQQITVQQPSTHIPNETALSEKPSPDKTPVVSAPVHIAIQRDERPEIIATPSLEEKKSESVEDFLGLFTEPTTPSIQPLVVEPEVAPVAVEQPVFVEPPRVVIQDEPIFPKEHISASDITETPPPMQNQPAPVENPPPSIPQSAEEKIKAPDTVVTQEHIDELAKEIPPTPASLVDVDTPQDVTPLVFGKKPEWSLKDLATPKHIEPEGEKVQEEAPEEIKAVTENETSKNIQFDLSRVSGEPGQSDQAPSKLASGNLIKPIETKSIAEIWLTGAKQAEKPIEPYSSSTPRSSLSFKRTMNSDIQKEGGNIVPKIETPPTPEPLPPQPVASPIASSVTPPLTAQSKPSISDVQHSTVNLSRKPLAEDIKRKNTIKRVVSIILGVLVLILLLSASVTFLLSHRGLSVEEKISSSLAQFPTWTSFSYSGGASADLVLSAPSSGEGVAQNGLVKLALTYTGLLKNTAEGFSDGTHRFTLKGGLQSGNFAWNTDLEPEVKIIGTTLYFHLLRYPAESGFDPDVMSNYWVKVDLATLAKELSLSGTKSSGQGYGDFGSGNSDMAFMRLYSANLPFVSDGKLDDETISGVSALHIKIKADKEKMYSFALALYKKYSGKDLVLSSGQQLRLKDALGKISGEIWMNPETYQLMKISVRGDFDDDIVDAHVKGNVQVAFDIGDKGKEVSVSEPTPYLTLEEFRSRTDDYKKNKELRERDQILQVGISKIIQALDAYLKEKGRYPVSLLDLRSAGKLPVKEMDDLEIKKYFYNSYLTPDSFSKGNRCTAKGKNCAFYHLGVNFEDVTNPELAKDADVNTEISGKDTAGCGGGINLSCYDVVSTSLSESSTTSPVDVGAVP